MQNIFFIMKKPKKKFAKLKKNIQKHFAYYCKMTSKLKISLKN